MTNVRKLTAASTATMPNSRRTTKTPNAAAVIAAARGLLDAESVLLRVLHHRPGLRVGPGRLGLRLDLGCAQRHEPPDLRLTVLGVQVEVDRDRLGRGL